jgi:DNA-binding PadR family transcriptional regulator
MLVVPHSIISGNFFLGFIRLHILFHASQEAVFGLDLIRELSRRGYILSPGTPYPILHELEGDGFLQAEKQLVHGKVRKYYVANEAGKVMLTESLLRVGS